MRKGRGGGCQPVRTYLPRYIYNANTNDKKLIKQGGISEKNSCSICEKFFPLNDGLKYMYTKRPSLQIIKKEVENANKLIKEFKEEDDRILKEKQVKEAKKQSLKAEDLIELIKAEEKQRSVLESEVLEYFQVIKIINLINNENIARNQLKETAMESFKNLTKNIERQRTFFIAQIELMKILILENTVNKEIELRKLIREEELESFHMLRSSYIIIRDKDIEAQKFESDLLEIIHGESQARYMLIKKESECFQDIIKNAKTSFLKASNPSKTPSVCSTSDFKEESNNTFDLINFLKLFMLKINLKTTDYKDLKGEFYIGSVLGVDIDYMLDEQYGGSLNLSGSIFLNLIGLSINGFLGLKIKCKNFIISFFYTESIDKNYKNSGGWVLLICGKYKKASLSWHNLP